MLRLAVAIVQTKLYILIHMRDHAEDVLHGTLLRVVKPRLFIGAFPESSIHCEVDLDGKFKAGISSCSLRIARNRAVS